MMTMMIMICSKALLHIFETFSVYSLFI